MDRRLLTLLVQNGSAADEQLALALKRLGIDAFRVSSCREAERLISQTEPCLIFVDVQLPDGTCADVIHAVHKVHLPSFIIMVGPSDAQQYRVLALKTGAFAFVAPPFEHETLGMLVRWAEREVRRQRRTLALAATS